MKTIIEENVHIYRIQSGLVEGATMVAGGSGEVKQEEALVGDLVNLIFKVGRERKWW